MQKQLEEPIAKLAIEVDSSTSRELYKANFESRMKNLWLIGQCFDLASSWTREAMGSGTPSRTAVNERTQYKDSEAVQTAANADESNQRSTAWQGSLISRTL
ncbi:MAG: hypothetical protein NDJ90_14010 [Oligoflexia bacterium]|nr:hypothetical protein [Oligoflexia bacterium]